jgi:penicillin-binding protein 1A
VEYKPKFPDDPYPLDYPYEITEGEYCTVHGPGALIPPSNEELTPPTNEETGSALNEGGTATITPTPGVGMTDPQNEDIGEPLEEENWDGIDWGADPDQWN